jgi:hypothetical protein
MHAHTDACATSFAVSSCAVAGNERAGLVHGMHVCFNAKLPKPPAHHGVWRLTTLCRCVLLLAVDPSGHQCIHTVSQLKKYAMVSDFTTLMGNVHAVQQRLTSDTYHTTRGLEHIKRDAGAAKRIGFPRHARARMALYIPALCFRRANFGLGSVE